MIQGAASDGVYFLLSGKVSVAARLPGGGENAVAERGPGELVGEMALLTRGGKRTATARALGEVDTLFTDRRYFGAALNLVRPASLKVLRRLGLILAQRLHGIRDLHRALVDAAPTSNLFRTLPAGDARPFSPFDVRAFLRILPCFREFSADEIDVVFAAARVEDVLRGANGQRRRQARSAAWWFGVRCCWGSGAARASISTKSWDLAASSASPRWWRMCPGIPPCSPQKINPARI